MTDETKVETWHKVRLGQVMPAMGHRASHFNPNWWCVQDRDDVMQAMCVFESQADRIIADHAKAAALDDARAALSRIINRCYSHRQVDKQGLMLSTRKDAEETLARLDNAKEPTQSSSND